MTTDFMDLLGNNHSILRKIAKTDFVFLAVSGQWLKGSPGTAMWGSDWEGYPGTAMALPVTFMEASSSYLVSYGVWYLD